MIDKDKEKNMLIRELYGLTKERSIEILSLSDPNDFTNASDFIDAVYANCKTENELKFLIAHLVTCFVESEMKLEFLSGMIKKLMVEKLIVAESCESCLDDVPQKPRDENTNVDYIR